MSGIPPTAFAADGDSYIAYQVLGDGEHDVLYVPTAVHPIDLMWDDPVRARGLRRLARTNRLIACDLIGVGSSDPVHFDDMPAMQAWADGLRVVLDAAGSEQASIFAMAEAGLPVMLFAASHPERVRSLVLWAGYARFARADDYPHGMPEEALRRYLDSFWEVVGTGDLIDRWAPSRADEAWFREWWGRGERLSGGRRYLSQIVERFLRTDVRGVLEAIQAPTLVLRRRDDPHVREGHAQFLVEHISDARVVELPGNDHEWFSGNTDEVLDAIEEFLTGRRTAVATNRVLATVLFTDIVASTERAAALGDTEWTRVIDAHEALVSRIIASHRGHVVKFTGDGVLATFDGPARAISAPSRSCRPHPVSGSRSGPGCTPVRSRSTRATSAASVCTSRPGSWPSPAAARCSSPARSRRWCSARACSSTTSVRGRSRASPNRGRCSASASPVRRGRPAPRSPSPTRPPVGRATGSAHAPPRA